MNSRLATLIFGILLLNPSVLADPDPVLGRTLCEYTLVGTSVQVRVTDLTQHTDVSPENPFVAVSSEIVAGLSILSERGPRIHSLFKGVGEHLQLPDGWDRGLDYVVRIHGKHRSEIEDSDLTDQTVVDVYFELSDTEVLQGVAISRLIEFIAERLLARLTSKDKSGLEATAALIVGEDAFSKRLPSNPEITDPLNRRLIRFAEELQEIRTTLRRRILRLALQEIREAVGTALETPSLEVATRELGAAVERITAIYHEALARMEDHHFAAIGGPDGFQDGFTEFFHKEILYPVTDPMTAANAVRVMDGHVEDLGGRVHSHARQIFGEAQAHVDQNPLQTGVVRRSPIHVGNELVELGFPQDPSWVSLLPNGSLFMNTSSDSGSFFFVGEDRSNENVSVTDLGNGTPVFMLSPNAVSGFLQKPRDAIKGWRFTTSSLSDFRGLNQRGRVLAISDSGYLLKRFGDREWVESPQGEEQEIPSRINEESGLSFLSGPDAHLLLAVEFFESGDQRLKLFGASDVTYPRGEDLPVQERLSGLAVRGNTAAVLRISETGERTLIVLEARTLDVIQTIPLGKPSENEKGRPIAATISADERYYAVAFEGGPARLVDLTTRRVHGPFSLRPTQPGGLVALGFTSGNRAIRAVWQVRESYELVEARLINSE